MKKQRRSISLIETRVKVGKRKANPRGGELPRPRETFEGSRGPPSLPLKATRILVQSFGSTSLVNASAKLANVAVLATLLILMLSVVAAVEIKSAHFWRMFAIWGWLFLVLAFFGPNDLAVKPFTESLLSKAADAMPNATRPLSASELRFFRRLDPTMAKFPTRLENSEFSQHFVIVGKACLTLLFALLGGVAALILRHWGREKALP